MNSRDRGFTLLEIMIALAIMAMALVTLLGLANRSIGVNERLQNLTEGTLLAQQKMTEVEVGNRDELLDGEGRFDPPHEKFAWEVRFEETPLPAVTMVTVTVVWGRKERNEMVDLNSFLFR